MSKYIFTVLILVFCQVNESNAAFSCEADIQRVLVYSDGSVNILHSGSGKYTYICNTKGNFKGVDTVTCSLWAGMLQSIQNNNKKAVFYYNGNGTCATLPTYSSAPAPVYIGSIK
ncbi:hypothetical protein [Shewanella sp. NKUCC06_TVS]|uniref:hypothetical protein n=1 Tax=Shewanella sp. NKUCC06_TVS TaxID=2842128 RepID=UPI001C5A83FE|nr:hypothetical protein [Shewanella sp. NKUCC06_TVS]MBW3532994.1 hypothetical protein [Shewanella sp. NKUCC06_TVS]